MSEDDNRPKTYGKRGQIIHAQAREIIAKVISFMKKEADLYQRTGKIEIPLPSYKQRVIAATGISEGTYKSVMKEAAQVASGAATTFRTPRQPDNCKQQVTQSTNSEAINTVNANASIQSSALPNQTPQTALFFIIPTLPLLTIKNNPIQESKCAPTDPSSHLYQCTNELEQYSCGDCKFANHSKVNLLQHQISAHLRNKSSES